jgi:tetratricopeptide (TPR) repeat protein
LSIVLIKLNKFENAEKLINEGLIHHPKNKELLLGLVEIYKELINHQPYYAEAYANLGNVFKELSMLDESLDAYNMAVILNPNLAGVYSIRGNLLQDLNKYQEALEDYDKAIALKPDYAEAYLNRENVLNELSRFEKTIESQNKAIEVDPNYDNFITIFVFLQVGEDPQTEMMVNSINLSNPNSRIIQCSDLQTNKINGVTEVFRLDSDVTNLMTFRLEVFAKLNLSQPAIYLDSDMLVLDKIVADKFLKEADLVLCKRSFYRYGEFDVNFKNMNLLQYSNKEIFEVYPILACFTITKSYEFWLTCFHNLLELDKKFHFWYGDQEVIRNIAITGKFKIHYVPESQVACLPEFFQKESPPLCLHFKGPDRKNLMMSFYSDLIFCAKKYI